MAKRKQQKTDKKPEDIDEASDEGGENEKENEDDDGDGDGDGDGDECS